MTDDTDDTDGGLPDEPVQVSREDYDGVWLEPLEPRADYSKFVHHPLRERPGQRATVRDALASALLDHHSDRRRVAARVAALGYEQAARFYREELPQADRTRKGSFGEVVATEHLAQRLGYSVPVYKLRIRETPDLPVRGEDIVAFVMSDDRRVTKVIVGEAKVFTAFRRATVREAHERLMTAWNPRPMTLGLLAEALYQQGDTELGAELDRVGDALASTQFPRESWVFLIGQAFPDDAFRDIEAAHETVADLRCAELQLSDLTAFVHDLFDNLGFDAEEVDDEGA